MMHIKALSLFAGGGIGETYLEEAGINTVLANELLPERAEIHKFRLPHTEMICGDIKTNKQEIIKRSKELGVNMVIATPPCQGMSNLGRRDYDNDERNYLIFDVFDIVDAIEPDFLFIENVPQFLKMNYPYKGDILPIKEIFQKKYGDEYNIVCGVYNAADYGVPQIRKRAIIRIYKKGIVWDDPEKQEHITLRKAIGHLPSIESGEDSGLPYHKGPKHIAMHIEALKHTPTGCSAHDNEVYYPKKGDGTRIKGYHNTYSRLSWDKVCPTRTINSGSVSGSNNGHPGRLKDDGTYSDARVLSILELFIVSSLPEDMKLPENTNEKLIREIVGEGIPPKMVEAFMRALTKK